MGVVPFLPAVGELVRWKAANCLILEAKSGNKVLLRNVKTGYSDIVPISELSGIDNGLCRDPKRDIDLVTLDPSKIVASQRRLEAILPLTEGRNSQLDYEEAAAKVEDLARIEHEMRVQEKDFRMLDETYNEHVMALTIARGYLRSLLENSRIVRFLSQHYREYLTEFQRIVESTSLER